MSPSPEEVGVLIAEYQDTKSQIASTVARMRSVSYIISRVDSHSSEDPERRSAIQSHNDGTNLSVSLLRRYGSEGPLQSVPVEDLNNVQGLIEEYVELERKRKRLGESIIQAGLRDVVQL